MPDKPDKILGTFRIERDKWENFKFLASNNGHTGSSALVDFINICLATNQISLPDISDIPKVELDSIDCVIDERINALIDRLGIKPVDSELMQVMVKREVENAIADFRQELDERLGELAA